MPATAPRPSMGRIAGVAVLALIAHGLLTYWLLAWQVGSWQVCNAAALAVTLPAALLLTGRRAEPVLMDSARPFRLLIGLILAAVFTWLVLVPNLLVALVLARITGSAALAVILAFVLSVPPLMWLAAKLLAALPWPAHLVAAPPVIAHSPTARRLSAATAAHPVVAVLAALVVLALVGGLLYSVLAPLSRLQPPSSSLGPLARPTATVTAPAPPQPTATVTVPPAPAPSAPEVPAPKLPDRPDLTEPPDRPARAGIASWYHGPPGGCAAKGFDRGTRIRVTHGEHSLTCRVTMTGPRISGRIVNLPQASFAKLAHPDRGLVQVTVHAVT